MGEIKFNIIFKPGFWQKLFKSLLTLSEIIEKPRLKVALISYHYQNPTISGVGIHARNLAKYISKNGCEVHVFCSSEEEGRYKEDGVIVHGIQKTLAPIEGSISRKRIEYDIFESEVVKACIRENLRRKIDIIHTQGLLTKAAFTVKKVCHIKWVHTFHAIERFRTNELTEEEKHFQDLNLWEESAVNFCDGAIFVSKALMKEGKHYKIMSKRIIPNGVDIEVFRNSPIKESNILFIGRFSLEKGIDALPSMMENAMRFKDATFTIVCPYRYMPSDLKKIRSVLKRLEQKFKGRVQIIETAQPQEKLKELYQDCQIYIQPSKYESFGLCILEAMAVGRPVIAFNVGGIPEVIGDCGILVNNKKDFIFNMEELLRDKEKCVKLGQMASNRAKKFNWSIISKQTINYYKEILK